MTTVELPVRSTRLLLARGDLLFPQRLFFFVGPRSHGAPFSTTAWHGGARRHRWIEFWRRAEGGVQRVRDEYPPEGISTGQEAIAQRCGPWFG